MTNTKVWLTNIGQHFRILLTGFKNMVTGVVTLCLFSGAAYGFYTTESEDGYAAVCSFIVSLVLLAIGVVGLYVLGSTKKATKERKCGK